MIIGISGKKQHGKDTVANIIQYLTSNGDEIYSFEEWINHYKEREKYKTLPDFQWKKKQFASKLKQVVSLFIGCTVEQLEDNDFKEKELGEEWKVWFWAHYKLKRDSDPSGRLGKIKATIQEATAEKQKWSPSFGEGEIGSYIPTPRKLLQLMGTECGRETLHPNIWINALMADYKRQDTHKHYPDGIGKYPNWIITDVRFPNEVEAIKNKGGLVFRVNRVGITSTDDHPSETALDSYTQWDGIILNNDMQSL